MTSDTKEVAVVVGGGPSISASCGRLFSNSGMQVALAARNPDCLLYTSDAADE